MQNAAVPGARGWMMARLLILAAVLAMGGFLWAACAHDLSVGTRVVAAVGALLSLAIPVRVLYVKARRYYRTGSWTISEEERSAWRRRYASDPRRRWFQPACTVVLLCMALSGAVSVAIRMHRHRPSPMDMLFFVVWVLFLAAQLRQFHRDRQTLVLKNKRLPSGL